MAEIPFGEWLKRRRKAAGLTQEQLALQISCSTSALKKIEAEERRPSAQIVERLAEVFNIPPNEGSAFLRFARGDWRFAPAEMTEDTPWRASPASTRSNLPSTVTSLIGREREIALVHKYLLNPDIRLVTLIGPPGIGKTRLSLEVARQALSDFPDGVFFAALAPLEDSKLVAPTVVQMLGFVEMKRRPAIEQLKDGIGAKQMLIVLDNCEHLIEEVVLLASDILSGCPRLKILATSRESLRMMGEWLYSVPTLDVPKETSGVDIDTASKFPALTLFTERARAVHSDFALTADNVQAVAAICTQLDGLPLAIELIAARIRLMSPEMLLARLNGQFTLYADGRRAVPARQKTLYDAISWSYHLLSTEEQNLFARLSVFAGGFTLEAAETIFSGVSTAKTVSALITSLFDKNLLQRRLDTHGEPRFNMLVTIQQFALDCLRRMGKEAEIRNWHLAYFVGLAEQAEPNLRAFDMVIWLDRLEAEHDNIRVALAWAMESDIEAELRLASALLWFWHIRGYRNEGVDWLEQGLSSEAIERGGQPLTPSRARIRGKALNTSGTLLTISFDFEKGQARLEESLALFRELGPAGKQGMAYVLLGLGVFQPRNILEQSLTLFREVGDKFGVAECLMQFAGMARENDDYKQALKFAKEHLALRREIGDQDGIATALGNLGELALDQDDYQRAINLFEESLAIFRKLGNKWAICFRLSVYGDIYLWQGNYERATKIYEEALSFARDISSKLFIAFNVYNLGATAWFQGYYVHATRMITDSLSVFREVGHDGLVASSLHALGDIALAQGKEEVAAQWYMSELTFGREIKFDLAIVFALGGLGKVAREKGDYGLAETRFQEALKVSREVGSKPAILFALCNLGRMAQLQGEYAAARTFYTEALKIQQQRINHPLVWLPLKTYIAAIAYPLEAFAILAAMHNEMERATKLFSAAEALYAPLRVEMSADERAEHDQAVDAARAALGEEAFSAAWAEGKAMTMEQAIAYVLEKSDD